MPEIQDDKAPYVVPFILERLTIHQQRHSQDANPPPFFIGLNGVQGAGKSVLVEVLKSALSSPPHALPTVVFSLDDLYLTHRDQVALAESHPDNPLVQHRGQPSTHDIPLALAVFSNLKQNRRTKIPQYNKAAFNGQGDRVPESEWEEVNCDPHTDPVRVVLFEGWCVGFRPLSPSTLKSKHEAAVAAARDPHTHYVGRLGHHTLQSLTDINEALRQYDAITDQLDAFIHIDAADPQYVYQWRLQQEKDLWEKKGSGMTDEQVRKFVDDYYPAYELYTDTLRSGVFRPAPEAGVDHGSVQRRGRQLRLVVGEDRKVRDVIRL